MATRTEAVQKPRISGVHPNAAIAGGDLQIRGSGFAAGAHPTVSIGEEPAHLVVASDSHIVVRVPETATAGDLIVASGNAQSDVWETHVGIQIADSLHPVANPAIDAEGNIFSTFSGSRGQKSPVSIYKIDTGDFCPGDPLNVLKMFPSASTAGLATGCRLSAIWMPTCVSQISL